MTKATTKATFENTYPRYPFAPLVEFAIMLASWIKAAEKPTGRLGATAAVRRSFDSAGNWIAPE